jgi:WD40 repeat protein
MIDQFEELFTQTLSERERQRFIDLLVAAVTEPVGPLIVLLTLRADFYDRPMHYPQLSQLIEAQHKSVLPMNLRDLRAVIEQPAALPDVQLLFEGDLVGDLLFEAQGQAGALPLLEFTLDQLFWQRDGHWLTREAYQQIGGVKGALAKHAESTYASLPSDQHRRLARALFLRLIDPGVTEQDTTRRRAALSELSLPNPKQTAIMREVADTFVTARLLMTNEVAGTTTIEVSHEALIREWARLAEWLREAREDITLQQAISGDAAEWTRRGRPVDRLYRGAQLTEAQVWAERNVPNADEVDFLHAGAIEQQYQEDVALNQQARELNLQRRAVNRLRGLVAVLTLLLAASIVFASVAQSLLQQVSTQNSTISAQAKNASARALAADATLALLQNQPDLALLLSVKATKTDPSTYEARNSLLSALEYSPRIITILRGESSPIGTLAFSHDGRTLLSSDGYSTFIWDTQRGTGHLLILKGKPLRIGSAALSPNGQVLVTSYADGVWLWNTQKGERQTQLAGTMQNLPADLIPTTTVAFSPDGTLVASGRCSQYSPNEDCLETSIPVWKTASTQPVGSPPIVIVAHANVNSIAFSPDDALIAASSLAGVQLWDLAKGQSRGPALPGSIGANSVAFSPDGKTLAVGCIDKTVHLWDVASGQPISSSPFTGHTDAVDSVAFSPTDNTLVSGSADGTLRLWDVATGQTIPPLFISDTQPKTKVAFSPDGKMLASGSADGTVILWDTDPVKSPINQRLEDVGGVRSALFSPDGKLLFTGDEHGQVLVQDAHTGKLLRTLPTGSYPLLTPPNAQGKSLAAIQSLALSKDGDKLAAGRLDGTIIIWNLKTGKPLAPPFKHPGLLHKVGLSADGRILASGGDGGTIVIWDVAKQTRLYLLHTAYPFSTLPIALSPDGQRLAAGSCGNLDADGTCRQVQVLLWNTATGKLIGHPLPVQQNTVLDVAFSPDGQKLASSSQDGIQLWNVTQEAPLGSPLTIPANSAAPHVDYYSNVVFNSDGTMLASYSAPGSPSFGFVLWTLEHHEAFADALSEAGSFLGSVAFSPDGQQLASVFARPGMGIFLLWDITIPLWQDHACTIANRNLTEKEWVQYVKDEPQRIKVCQKLPLDT